MDTLKYPIGKFVFTDQFTREEIESWIEDIAAAPLAFRQVAEGMSDEQLNTPYRPGGWTARQVLHHIPDSHMQAYCRFKLVLTEDSPTIKPYLENLWAELNDTRLTPVSVSLDLLEALHRRWVILMRQMATSDFDRYYIHPQYGKNYPLGAVCKLYAWHGKHHLAHLKLIIS